MNNLLPVYWARKNVQEALDKISNTNTFSKYLDSIFQAIRTQSLKGHLGTEILLNHPLVESVPQEALAVLVAKALNGAGYSIQFKQRGFINKKRTVVIYWGIPEEETK